jgi:hypothetical protein
LIEGHGPHLDLDGSSAATLRALASTREAGLGQRHFERTGQTAVGVIEGNLEFVVVVCASYGATLPTKGATEHLGEDVVGVGARESVWISLGRPEPVKVLTLLWVAQDLVGLLDFFKLLRVTAFVWVVFSGKFAMGLFDVISRGVPGQTEDVVHLILV